MKEFLTKYGELVRYNTDYEIESVTIFNLEICSHEIDVTVKPDALPDQLIWDLEAELKRYLEDRTPEVA